MAIFHQLDLTRLQSFHWVAPPASSSVLMASSAEVNSLNATDGPERRQSRRRLFLSLIFQYFLKPRATCKQHRSALRRFQLLADNRIWFMGSDQPRPQHYWKPQRRTGCVWWIYFTYLLAIKLLPPPKKKAAMVSKTTEVVSRGETGWKNSFCCQTLVWMKIVLNCNEEK